MSDKTSNSGSKMRIQHTKKGKTMARKTIKFTVKKHLN